MAYTKAQAKKLASQIHSRFGQRIASATKNTPVPPEFVAGLIGVEAGRDKKTDRINEHSTRFERGVFGRLKRVRDGALRSWGRIKRADIADASDDALKNLATSFGVCQVMGWHTIHNLACTIAELRDPEKHIGYAVKLLLLNSADGDFERKEYVGEFKEWNTGSETGRTYHKDYVANAGAVMDAYRELLKTETFVTGEVEQPTKAEASPEAPAPAQNIPAIPPLPVNVPGWVKKIVGWGSGLSFGGLGASFTFLRDNPEALMAVLNILKWGFVVLGVIVGVVALGLFAKSLWNAKLANDLNVARLRNYADPETRNVDFSGWKSAPDKSEVRL